MSLGNAHAFGWHSCFLPWICTRIGKARSHTVPAAQGQQMLLGGAGPRWRDQL